MHASRAALTSLSRSAVSRLSAVRLLLLFFCIFHLCDR